MKLDVEHAVLGRYTDGAASVQDSLCCPVTYRADLLQAIPREIIEKDYGCGDPSRYLRPGETVLDLGSGAGKICFIAAQVVGPRGRVIGVDMNEEMLALARKHQSAVAQALGFDNVEFRRGRIQDLALDLDALDVELRSRPVSSSASYLAAELLANELRQTRPLIPAGSIDVVVSNCVLNLVRPEAKDQLLGEIYRALREGGRAVISDIVSDQDVPAEMQNDPELWSGCVSGAFREDLFPEAFARRGFYGIRILHREKAPWRAVRGLEFRSVTLEAFKGGDGPGLEGGRAVIYKGPFKEVLDDEGRRLTRGRREIVSEKSFRRFQGEPYLGQFDFVEPPSQGPAEAGPPSCCGPAPAALLA
jgi:arsenite methyltransferase